MTTLNEALNDFLLACKADGLREATVKWYASILNAMVETLGDEPLDAISTKMMREYIVNLHERDSRFVDAKQRPQQSGGLSRDSVASHVTGIHRFWNWCADEYSLLDNPMRNIRRPKRPPRQPKAINPRDFVKLFNATLNNDAGTRDRAMLSFFADTGCRLSGLIKLKVEHLHLDAHRAIVYEKGQKSRVVVYTAITRRLLAEWMNIRPESSDMVFCNVTTGDALTPSGIHQILRRLKERADVRGRVNPHAFRHNFARQYILNGGDVVTLAKLLGHNNVTTTVDYYAVFTPNELSELHSKYSPMKGFELKD